MPTLMLIDGNSLTYRAFHALPPDLSTASGQITNAVFGFTSMLINLMRDHTPDGVIVAFDRPEPTFRHKLVDTYKANRDKAPDTLREQMGLVKQVLDTVGITQIEQVGFEADDLIATLATRAAAEQFDVLIVTGDRDSYQLVEDPHIKVVYNKRGVSDYALYDEAGILERTGVTPNLYVQYAALRGDSSDNLPGIPGVGEKTAAKLINKYGGLEGIFANVDGQTPKLKENLIANEALARSNEQMMELVRDVPIDGDLGDLMARDDIDPDSLKQLFDFLEFHSLAKRFNAAFGVDGDEGQSDTAQTVLPELEAVVRAVANPEEAVTALSQAATAGAPLGFAAGYDGDTFAGLAVVSDPTASQVIWLDHDLVADDAVRVALLSCGETAGFVGHDAKSDLRRMLGLGLDLTGCLRNDTAVGEYLLEPAGGNVRLDELVARYAGLAFPRASAAEPGQLDFGSDTVAPSLVAARNALGAHLVGGAMDAALDENGLTRLHDDIEIPLVGVLARMEHVGVGVDRAGLERLRADMTAEAEQLAEQIQVSADERFNVNSTKALQQVLFEKLELPPQKKTKTGFSTNQATLEKLVGEHEIIDLLLRYREVEKLRSTYGESLIASVGPDDRIHATFNQMVARTGRLSSENPNLHNIPVRTELGRSFRTAFVPRVGCQLLVADYNQIELRCIAHLAEDPGLIEAFTSGTDVHSAVAGRVFGIAPADVTFEQRSKAKMVSYGLAYGMEAYGLGQRLGIRVSEAAEILDAYFAGFPSVRAYMDATVTEARNRGYTETLFGRRRPIPELLSDNPRVRQAGERQAMNAGIQGLAADIFKVALLRLDERLRTEKLVSRVTLQVHDEVILEVPAGEEEVATAAVTEELVGAFAMNVPLEVNLSFGATWADAKG